MLLLCRLSAEMTTAWSSTTRESLRTQERLEEVTQPGQYVANQSPHQRCLRWQADDVTVHFGTRSKPNIFCKKITDFPVSKYSLQKQKYIGDAVFKGRWDLPGNREFEFSKMWQR